MRSSAKSLSTALLLFVMITDLALSRVTLTSSGTLDCVSTYECNGEDVIIERDLSFEIECDGTDSCRGSNITIMPECLMNGPINCEGQDACRDSTLTVYHSDLDGDYLNCYFDGSDSGLCQNMTVYMWGHSHLKLRCGSDIYNSCVGMTVHVHDLSTLRVSPSSIHTPITVYLYDEATVNKNGEEFTVITMNPTMSPTGLPIGIPTSVSVSPTQSPSAQPSGAPTAPPTATPTVYPSVATSFPTSVTSNPSKTPTQSPTSSPILRTAMPSEYPTLIPIGNTNLPSEQPTQQPSLNQISDDGDDETRTGEMKSKDNTEDVLIVTIVVIAVLILVVSVLFAYLCFINQQRTEQRRLNELGDCNKGDKLNRVTSVSSTHITAAEEHIEGELVQSELVTDSDNHDINVEHSDNISDDLEMEKDEIITENPQSKMVIHLEPEGNPIDTRALHVKAICEEDEHELMYEGGEQPVTTPRDPTPGNNDTPM